MLKQNLAQAVISIAAQTRNRGTAFIVANHSPDLSYLLFFEQTCSVFKRLFSSTQQSVLAVIMTISPQNLVADPAPLPGSGSCYRGLVPPQCQYVFPVDEQCQTRPIEGKYTLRIGFAPRLSG